MIGKMTKTEQPEVPFAWALDDCSNGRKKNRMLPRCMLHWLVRIKVYVALPRRVFVSI